MNAVEHGTTAYLYGEPPQAQAAATFNGGVEEATAGGRVSPGRLVTVLDAKAELLPEDAAQCLLKREIMHVRHELVHVTYVGGLENKEGVVGEFNGEDQSISIDQSQLRVGEGGFSQMYAELGKTVEHEIYHRQNEHGKALTPGVSAHGDTVVVMGGVELTDEGLKEALNVIDVAPVPAYQRYVADLLLATTNAHIGMGEVREAVNTKHDVSGFDDGAWAPQRGAPTT